MAAKLVDFMLSVAQDPDALAKYQLDPDAAAAGAGLSRADQAILKRGNPTRIRDAISRDLGTSAADSADSVVVITLTWVSSMEAELLRPEINARFEKVADRLQG